MQQIGLNIVGLKQTSFRGFPKNVSVPKSAKKDALPKTQDNNVTQKNIAIGAVISALVLATLFGLKKTGVIENLKKAFKKPQLTPTDISAAGSKISSINVSEYKTTLASNKAADMLTEDNVAGVQEYMRKNRMFLCGHIPVDENEVLEEMFEINGRLYNAKYLGGGGSKNVFQIEKDGEKFAIGLCTYVDGPVGASQKWLNVINNEAKNTNFLRSNGFKTNDIFDIIPVKVNGKEFPAVLMKAYNEHSFVVADKKNYSFVDLIDVDGLNDEKIIDLFEDITSEIAKAVHIGVAPKYDSVNLCKDKTNGTFHLFFNDLDQENLLKSFSDESAFDAISQYVNYSLSALNSTVDYQKASSNEYFWNIDRNTELLAKLKDICYGKYLKLQQ